MDFGRDMVVEMDHVPNACKWRSSCPSTIFPTVWTWTFHFLFVFCLLRVTGYGFGDYGLRRIEKRVMGYGVRRKKVQMEPDNNVLGHVAHTPCCQQGLVCLGSARPLLTVHCPLSTFLYSPIFPPKQTHPIPYPLLCPKFSRIVFDQKMPLSLQMSGKCRQQLRSGGNNWNRLRLRLRQCPGGILQRGWTGHIFHLSRPEPGATSLVLKTSYQLASISEARHFGGCFRESTS